MCDPVLGTLAFAAVSTLGAGLNIMGQEGQQKANIDYQRRLGAARNEAIIANQKRASEDYMRLAAVESDRILEERAAKSAQKTDLQKETLQKKGSARVSSAEAGVAGLSLQGLLADFDRQEAVMFSRFNQDQSFKDNQHKRNQEGFLTELRGRNQSIQPYVASPVAPVDYLGPILGVASSALSFGAGVGAFSSTPKIT